LVAFLLLATIIGTNNQEEKASNDKKAVEKEKDGKGDFGNATDVRNDKTGKWKKVVTSKAFDVEEDGKGYHEEYMNKDEIHFIVSFATNTTTVIREDLGIITAEVHEYEDKEEHDAKTLGSGMLLKEYMIDQDGKVTELD